MTAVGAARAVDPFLLGFDVYEPASEGMLRAAWDAGYRWIGRYLNNLTPPEVARIHDEGLGILPYTVAMTSEPLSPAAGRLYGANMALRALQLGVPPSTHIAIDLEAPLAGSDVAGHVNAMAGELGANGYGSALYVGVPQPLTGAELFRLRPTRYIKGGGFAAEPSCGWAAIQLEPLEGGLLAGVKVDVEISKHDYLGRSLVLWWPR